MTLITICLGYFMVILDATVVNVALPVLRADLRTTVAGLQWIVDAYTLMFAALLLSGGALGDRLGAKPVFQAGLALFFGASIGCGLAGSTPVLIAARLVQGVGAALLVPASLALLQVAYQDSAARARAVGAWGGIAGIAAAAGPVIGGVIVGAVNWRAVFFLNVPIGLAVLALSVRYAPRAPGRPERSLDLGGQATGVLALSGLTAALIEAGHGGAGWMIAGGFAVALAALAGFLWLEHRGPEPMLPLALFRQPTFSGASLVGFLINLGFYGELFVINLYFQQSLHYRPLLAGLALLPQMGIVALGSAASGWFTGRRGTPRATMLIGLAIGAAGLFGLSLAGAETPYWWLVAPLLAAGFGMSFTMPAATTAVVDAAPGEEAGIASGIINASRQVGGVIGVALLGGLIGRQAVLIGGFRIAVALAGAAFLAAAVVTYLTVDRAPRRVRPSARGGPLLAAGERGQAARARAGARGGVDRAQDFTSRR